MELTDLNKDKLYYLASPYSTPETFAGDTTFNNYLPFEMSQEDMQKALREEPGFLKRMRYHQTESVAVELIRQGLSLIEPIAMSHPKSEDYHLPQEFSYWEKRDKLFIDRCDAILIVGLDGWLESTGVRAEIEHARATDKPIFILRIDFSTDELITIVTPIYFGTEEAFQNVTKTPWGRKVHRSRLALGLSLEDAAVRCNLRVGDLQNFEDGTAKPNMTQFNQVNYALNPATLSIIELDDIIGQSEVS